MSVATHDLCLGCTELMAGIAQCACGTGVANLDLVTVRPAVPDLVPSRFGVAPVRGADMGFRQRGRSRRCRSSWDAGGAHSCNGVLDVGNGFGECCVDGHQVFDSGILLNGCGLQDCQGEMPSVVPVQVRRPDLHQMVSCRQPCD